MIVCLSAVSTIFSLIITSRTFLFCGAVESDLQNNSLKNLLLQAINVSVLEKANNFTNSVSSDKSRSEINHEQYALNQRHSKDLYSNGRENGSDNPTRNTTLPDKFIQNASSSDISNTSMRNHEIYKSEKLSTSGSVLEEDFFNQLVEIFSERARQFKNRMQTLLTDGLDNEYPKKFQESSSSGGTNFEKTEDNIQESKGPGSVEANIFGDIHKSSRRKAARQFQFVFNPYLPYGKEVLPDEKLSIHDALPAKMVKFIKSMVEDAPWEAMFMKMVRMVVDQFVDKIIETMFAGKGAEDKWRSADGPLTLISSLFPSYTTVERVRRSADKLTKESQSENGIPPVNHLTKDAVSKEVGEHGNDSWLDLFLDYVFPDDEKVDEKSLNKLTMSNRRKRDTSNSVDKEHEDLQSLSNANLFDEMDSFLFTLKFRQALRDFLKYRILKRVLRPLTSWRDVTDTKRIDVKAYPNSFISSHQKKRGILSRFQTFRDENNPNFINLIRHKRSFRGNSRRIDDEANDLHQINQKLRTPTIKKDDDNSDRLWQSHHGIRSSHFKRDDCSLRRACNAGRLLSRLPSVEDITLQLKSHHHEPHWDALLWGLKKKRCSRIFCKRQRSPKGSKHIWETSDKRQHRKIRLTTPTSNFEEDDLTTVIPF